MVSIVPITPYLPKNALEFCTNPYDVISNEEEIELKKNPKSIIHLLLPEGEGEEIFENAQKTFLNFQKEEIIKKAEKPAIYIYKQESHDFSQQGIILGVELQDYVEKKIVKHEHTRIKPLKNRTKHIKSINAATGLVWNVFKADSKINEIIEKIKLQNPIFDFTSNYYRQIIWQETNLKIISELQDLFKTKKLFIADGHHRAASVYEYRKSKLETIAQPNGKEPWQYLMTYISSDDQIWILPYNRVIRKLPMSKEKFLDKLQENFIVSLADGPFNPVKKNQIAICLKDNWYLLQVKDTSFSSIKDSLDVTIVQNKILDEILNIKDPRSDKNLFFVGNVQYYQDPSLMETKFIREQGNDLFINLFGVDIHDIEEIASADEVMPPKSTWFEPKLLSGITIYDLEGN